jgi:hypothetical protein
LLVFTEMKSLNATVGRSWLPASENLSEVQKEGSPVSQLSISRSPFTEPYPGCA